MDQDELFKLVSGVVERGESDLDKVVKERSVPMATLLMRLLEDPEKVIKDSTAGDASAATFLAEMASIALAGAFLRGLTRELRIDADGGN